LQGPFCFIPQFPVFLQPMIQKNRFIISVFCLLASFMGNAQIQKGLGTFYHQSHWGGRTYSGEKYHPYVYSAAHKSLPMGSWVEVVLVKTGKKVVVRVNDRGPFFRGGVIDVSKCAAQDLGLVPFGISKVEVRLLSPEEITDSLKISWAQRDSVGRAEHPFVPKKKKKTSRKKRKKKKSRKR
jgi:rare lipoprotein A